MAIKLFTSHVSPLKIKLGSEVNQINEIVPTLIKIPKVLQSTMAIKLFTSQVSP